MCVCKCGKCECSLNELQEKDRKEDKVHDFLYGLDNAFRTICLSLVSRTPIQSLEEVYNVVRQEEDLKPNVRTNEEVAEVTAFATQQRPWFNQSKTNEQEKMSFCRHCQHTCHASDCCFAVTGYPEWWGEKPRNRTMQAKAREGPNVNAGHGRGNIPYANSVHVPS